MSNKNPEDKNSKKSFLDTVREINAADRKAEIEEEAREAEARAERQRQQRKAYEDKLRQERLELMKLKQGVISEEEMEKPPEEPEKVYSLWEKISNFFYHNKVYIILGAMLGAIAIFLIYDYVTTVRPDIQGMFIAVDYDMTAYAQRVGEVLSPYGEDYNGDKKNVVKVYYVPTGYADESVMSMYMAQSDRTQLLGEFQSGQTIMIIGTKESYDAIGVLEGSVFADCRELFPDDPYAEELGYRLAGTDLKELINRPDMEDENLYVSFRRPVKTMGMSEDKMRVNFDRTVKFWRAYIAEHRIDGLELPEVPDPEPVQGMYDYTEETAQQ